MDANRRYNREQLSTMALESVEQQHRFGYVSDDDWAWFKCAWRNGRPRFSNLYMEHEGHSPTCNTIPAMPGEVVVGSAEWEAQEAARLAALKPDGDPISKEGTL